MTASDAPPPARTGRWPLSARILAGLVVGATAGLVVNAVLGGEDARVAWVTSRVTEPIGQLFVRLLLMTVVPLVASSLLVGVAGMGDLRTLGRVGLKAFGYCLVISAISVALGITLANTLEPGRRVAPETAQALRERYGADAARRVEDTKKATEAPLMQVVKTFVPSNPIAAVAGDTPNLLHLMVFTLLLGIATTLVPPAVATPFLRAVEGLQAIATRLIDLIMQVAPVAVACLLFNNVARFGMDLLGALGWFMATVLIGLGVHLFGVYSASVWLLSGIRPLDFFRRTRTIALTAFSTSSSNATLPTTLAVTERELGVPKAINSFVLTVGATANQNGTALYEGVTVLFLAQLSGVDLTLGQQVMVAYLAMIGSIGTAGVPAGSIPFIVLVLATIGLEPALIAIILGVDRILDMCRTTVNVLGDVTAATYVARSEGGLTPFPSGKGV
jgi:DAACS family dicarboxylate/amino acid:cation (Na+ or H+) symporter